MYIKEQTLDDLLHRVISKLQSSKNRIKASRGEATELTGVLLQLANPRSRLSRTEQKQHVFSSLGELLWYLSGSNGLEFITYYVKRYIQESDDGLTVHGGYGPRLLAMDGRHNQISNVIELLRTRPSSRRAVIQLFDAGDIAAPYKEIPCTCTLQFMVRGGRLQMLTYMRSNDAFIGLPHDVFAFTMLQEIIARSIGTEVGPYKHAVGSLHLYEDDKERAEAYIQEGFQSHIAMPPMPSGDPWRSIAVLREAEFQIRCGAHLNAEKLAVSPYWRDLIRLLQIYRHFQDGDGNKIARVNKTMSSDVFGPYIEQKRRTAIKRAPSEVKGQLRLPFDLQERSG
jgi:thymidylate synthase